MPLTNDGAARLAVELERAGERVAPPALVWLWDGDAMSERRATLYAWRDGAPRRGLVVRHERGPVDLVEWVCERFLRTRRE